jgi:hypothetical protein
MRVVNAEVVSDPVGWSQTVPPAAAFDTQAAARAIRAAARAADAFVQATGARPATGLLDALDGVLRLDDWLAAQPYGVLPPQLAQRFRATLLARGRRLFDQMKSGALGIGDLPEAPRFGAASSGLLTLALWTGGLWLLDRWLDRRRG